MKPISDVIFEHQVKVFKAFKNYVKTNKVKVPPSDSEKRELFVRWYLIEFDDNDIEEIVNDLSNNFLFLSEKTTESIIFNNAKRSSKNKE